ncbi:hypothetical protein [Roseivirga seohaensis]|uniref:hypothetical protein n=1 Tax=Roseivirga seohaensis TaxID=1914963 RepID=UPI003BA878DC
MTEESGHMKEAEINPFVRVVKFFYPKTQKPVNFGYLIFGVVFLLLYGTALYLFTDQVFDPLTSAFEYNYITRRVWIGCLLNFSGVIALLMLRKIGWLLIALAQLYSLIVSFARASELGLFQFNIAYYSLILSSVILIYLYFGRPVKVLNIDKRLMILPVIMAVLVYSIEYVVLFLTMEP